ncbi:MAG: EAL domain-containing protein [Woeseiaceae bacterium]
MKLYVFSIRTILAFIIGLMGLFAIALASLSGSINRDLVFDNQRKVMSELIRFEVEEKLKDLNEISQDLGLSLQSDTAFKTAFRKKDNESLLNLLNNQFHQYFVTADVIKLEQLILLNKDYSFILESTEGSVTFREKQQTICSRLFQHAKLRTGAQRIKVIHDICFYQNRPIYTVIVPVGGLRIKGYIIVITNPTHNLKSLESNLGMPVRFRLNNNTTAYQSLEWPTIESSALISNYKLNTLSNLPILTISTAQNINILSKSLQQSRLELLLIATLGILFITIFSVYITRKTLLIPLNQITEKLHELHGNKALTGEQLEFTGTKEIHKIIKGFNSMSMKLGNLYQSLQQMAYTDSLTKLPNRNQFQNTLEHHILIHQETETSFTLLLIDLDRFKSVNDTLGHHIGDILLQEVGLRLHNILRDDDIFSKLDQKLILELNDDMVARLGGDEFSAILTSIHTREDSITVAKKLLKAMEQPFSVDNHQLTIGLSIGIAMYPEHGTDMHTLVSHADIAMYNAKNNGNGFSIYDATQNIHTLHNLKLEQDLFASIKNNELVLHYQPKILVSNKSVVGVEALIRWQHPIHGLISPDDFIPIAEQTGFIQELTLWVLNQTLEDCSNHKFANTPSSISINLSALNLRDEKITLKISEALKKWSIPPEILTLELTESTIMSDPEFATAILTKLDAMGVSLSIDDFGTGYSSLAYVKNLPIDELKIDKSFIQDITKDSNNEAIVRAVLVLAHHMNLSVVAEGVENIETFEMLRELGCDIVQGYYFARPMPLEEYTAWLKAR